ncbi:unnamed protein product [Phaeothamnion confervicola]
MLDLPCDYLKIDVLDVLGTNRMNVTADVHRWHLDDTGLARAYHGRNREQRDIVLSEPDLWDLEALHEDGIHVVDLVEDDFEEWLASNRFTFVLFYAPWCVWCQRMMPTWEAFAEAAEEGAMPISVAQVDCAAENDLCMQQEVKAFPMMRLYHGTAPIDPDYRLDRTVDNLLAWTEAKVVEHRERVRAEAEAAAAGGAAGVAAAAALHGVHDDAWPGCLVAGTLYVNRVPGNFHIEAGSKSHNFHAAMTNLSHIVHHMSFGQKPSRRVRRKLSKLPEDFVQLAPIDNNVYVVEEEHRAFHHYFKVVPTLYDVGMRKPWYSYQALATSQVMHYAVDDVPEARFAYTLSPMAVQVKLEGTRWYKFLTSLLAIIGGTFSILGLVDAVIYQIGRRKGKPLR